ncbi:MAG: FAD-dependent oxidoreductase [Candidatus Firestonebacteria bacterium]
MIHFIHTKLPATTKTFSGDNYEDVTEMNIAGRKLILKEILELKKNNKNIYPILIPSIPQFRMTRRLQGVFELDEKDNKKFFYDSIGMTGDWRKEGPIFYIPYRCLIGAKIDNLITAGRCISVTTTAWDITRAIPTCAVTGEAAGTAAAILSSNNENFSDINVEKLQNQLKKQGVIINRKFSVA